MIRSGLLSDDVIQGIVAGMYPHRKPEKPTGMILHPLETADSAFLSTEKHGVVFVGRIVHSAYEVPFLARYPSWVLPS